MNTRLLEHASPAFAGAAPSAKPNRLARALAPAALAESGFVAFLLLVFVGVAPFTTQDGRPAADLAASGAGDALRQISYLLTFAIIAGAGFKLRGTAALRAVPPVFAVLLLWCIASAAWSLDPGVTLRRAVLLCVVSASVLVSVETIGAARCFKLLFYVLAAVVAIDWISIALVPQAKHLPDDFETSVVGDWRGVHGHKNVAGAFYANAAMIFLFFGAVTRRRSAFVLALASLGFLVGTQSKSSLALLPIAIAAGVVFRAAGRNRLNRQIAAVAGALLATIVLAAASAWWATIATDLRNPELFTGRTAIWQAEWAYIRDHPLLGSGFGSFAYTGKTSPIYQYIDTAWAGAVANGHQGYLELLLTVGLPGFLLAGVCLALEPLARLARPSRLPSDVKALLFAMFVFFFAHNFMESDFLKTDGAEWVTFLLVLAMLRSSRLAATPDSAQRLA